MTERRRRERPVMATQRVRTMMRVVREKTISWTERVMQVESSLEVEVAVLLLLLSVRRDEVDDMVSGVVVAIEV
jgi:hypothetical protein